MSLQAARYSEVHCSVCGQSFDTMAKFKGHTDQNGRHCIGGTPE